MKKKCNKCGETKPTTRFSKSHTNRDGLTGSCSDCIAVYNRKYHRKAAKRDKIERGDLVTPIQRGPGIPCRDAPVVVTKIKPGLIKGIDSARRPECPRGNIRIFRHKEWIIKKGSVV